jgi:hypothetical protein
MTTKVRVKGERTFAGGTPADDPSSWKRSGSTS